MAHNCGGKPKYTAIRSNAEVPSSDGYYVATKVIIVKILYKKWKNAYDNVGGKDGYQVYIHYDYENKDAFGRGENYNYILGYECGLHQLGWF